MSAPSNPAVWTVSTTPSADRSPESPKESQSRQHGCSLRIVRCLDYHKDLPDAVFDDYMQLCQEYWAYGATKTLIAAQRVVAAAPDFSWGWSGVANGFMQIAQTEDDSRRPWKRRVPQWRRAGDKALALDPKNSDALAHRALLIDRTNWTEQEDLLKRDRGPSRLIEHYVYGEMLQNVGRLADASEQFRHATDMLHFCALPALPG